MKDFAALCMRFIRRYEQQDAQFQSLSKDNDRLRRGDVA
jgi:hypothetical protein